MKQLKTLVSIVLPIAAVAASSYLLLRMRAQQWLPAPSEILDASPEQAIYGVVWLLAVSLTVWLVLTTILSVVVYSTRLPVAIRTVEWMTLPPIRRLGKRWAGILLAMGSMTVAGAAGATVAPPIPLVVGDDQPFTADLYSTGVSTGLPVGASIPAAVPVGASAVQSETVFPGGGTVLYTPRFVPLPSGGHSSDELTGTVVYTVRPGDNLWSISANHISEKPGHASSRAEITALWRRVVEFNRDRLRSGDPHLIFPGETILLPAHPHSPGE